MRTIAATATAFVSIVVLAACQTTETELKESGAPPLSAAQVSEIFTDSTLRSETQKGNPVYIYYAPDGAMKGLVTWKGGSERDAGRWEVSNDGLLCAQWDTWREAERSCWQLYTMDGKLVWEDRVNSDGPKVDDSDMPEKGNTMDL